jgi:hypothetical protein
MPTNGAKRMSPLDNALFHDWKEAVRKRCPLTIGNIEQVMSDEWNNIKSETIAVHFRHCRLTPHSDAYSDCPQPSIHKHNRSKQK